jgi:type I restriction enzyme M protein
MAICLPRERVQTAESRARYYIRTIAKPKGWNLSHVNRGGDCLEEQEIGAFLPDFLFTIAGEPAIIIEAKNEADKIDEAIHDAIGYADQINATGRYSIKVAVGAAGEENTGFTVYVRFLTQNGWVPLLSNGYEITTIPSRRARAHNFRTHTL